MDTGSPDRLGATGCAQDSPPLASIHAKEPQSGRHCTVTKGQSMVPVLVAEDQVTPDKVRSFEKAASASGSALRHIPGSRKTMGGLWDRSSSFAHAQGMNRRGNCDTCPRTGETESEKRFTEGGPRQDARAEAGRCARTARGRHGIPPTGLWQGRARAPAGPRSGHCQSPTVCARAVMEGRGETL
ncbi:hypothetical protein NDU88_006208 [Pleurodeles waltl]|uniref:Uncharacterized protein n=1 Tax=Pleurodeles waltl TaxID=8319 RepID=A0AAV7SP50_PLEWA|nr:hypothetical protein NDU88_006208 [Pleurodeles waltl]